MSPAQLTVRLFLTGAACLPLECGHLGVTAKGKDVVWVSCPDREVGADRSRLALALGVAASLCWGAALP